MQYCDGINDDTWWCQVMLGLLIALDDKIWPAYISSHDIYTSTWFIGLFVYNSFAYYDIINSDVILVYY